MFLVQFPETPLTDMHRTAPHRLQLFCLRFHTAAAEQACIRGFPARRVVAQCTAAIPSIARRRRGMLDFG